MFTGLVEAIGEVLAVQNDGQGGRVLRVAETTLASQLALGESVAVNGACLTVVDRDADSFRFQAGPETLDRTNLGRLAVGDPVNLERALRVGDRLGGHFVQGHVDGVGRVRTVTEEGFVVEAPVELLRYCVEKGSVAVEGVSLTIADLREDSFTVALVPHTREATTLGALSPGDEVNLEVDLLAKYVERLLH
jgi:riboflavin synthase